MQCYAGIPAACRISYLLTCATLMLSPTTHTSLSLSLILPLPNKPTYILLNASKLPSQQLCKTCHSLKFKSYLWFFDERGHKEPRQMEASWVLFQTPFCFLFASIKDLRSYSLTAGASKLCSPWVRSGPQPVFVNSFIGT